MVQELIRISNKANNQLVIVFFSDVEGVSVQKNKGLHQRRVVLEFLKREFNDEKLTIVRNRDGAPSLLNRGEELSISHSGNIYALQLRNNFPVGIDVQCYKKDIGKGTFYFVNEEEQNSFEMSTENLHVIWSVKEAVYKMLKGKVERYREDLTIVSIDKSRALVCHKTEVYEFHYQLEQDFILVYAS